MPTAVQCRDLRKTYDGKVEAVRGLNLEIQTASASACSGRTGRGRPRPSKFSKACSRQLRAKCRSWAIPGSENEREMREWLGISLQETRLSEKLTVRETIELFASFYREPRSSDEVLDQLQLTEKADSWVGKLSGGQRQRLAVATALVCNPKILFLDEPTTGLDPQSRRQLWDIIREFQRDGGTVLLTTHYMDEAERLCDRLAIVDHGQIIAEGSPADLIDRLGGHHVVEFSVSGNSDGAGLQAWRGLPSVESVREDDGMVALNVKQPHLTIPALLDAIDQQGSALQHLTTRQASLEDVFVRLDRTPSAGRVSLGLRHSI